MKLGDANSRMKELFDMWLLAASFEFDGLSLAAAVAQHSRRQCTAVEVEPVAFSERFAHDPLKAAQWRAFVRRTLLADAPTAFPDVARPVRDFLQPVAAAIIADRPWARNWCAAGGPGETPFEGSD